MQSFFKNLFTSCLGTLLALGALIFIFTTIIGRMASSSQKAPSVKANTVLELKFSGPIPERTNNAEGGNSFKLKGGDVLGLHDIEKILAQAKEDSNIKGILIECGNGAMGGLSTASVLRRAIENFKQSGKFVVSYSESYSQRGYYLASVADKIYMHPDGLIEFRGASATIPFFKDMLDRLGIKMQVYYAGQFKSATEPFRLDKMSDQNRLQVREFLSQNYSLSLDEISKSRNIPKEELMRLSDGFLARTADDAVKYRLADGKAYRDEVLSDLRNRLGLDSKENVNSVSLSNYYESKGLDLDFTTKDKVAVVYAEGNIVDGKGAIGSIGGQKYAEIIRKIRQDDAVKAIVLRVNSGGGSSMASENIWRELSLAKESGKKIVVSMGDYAASGGYYISCAADSIIAEPNTITGSIGVFGMVPSVQKMLKEKAGITFDTVKVGQYSAGFTPFFDFTNNEGAFMQQFVDKTYETFLKRVGTARHKSRDEVHAIAQGRVWTGAKAKEIGLVDKLGNLDDAIAMAGRLAGIEKYRTVEFPSVKEPFQQLIEKFTNPDNDDDKEDGDYIKSQFIKSELGEMYPFYEYLKTVRTMKGVQMRLPFQVEIK